MKDLGSLQKVLDEYVGSLKHIYGEELRSIVLYGSAASGEFAGQASNLNILVVLASTDPAALEKCSRLLDKPKYAKFDTVFFTEDFIRRSCDVFPIEFLDMKENYRVLTGDDVLAGLQVELKNLRFQCEYELKSKLVTLKKSFVVTAGNKTALQGLLFNTFIATLHVSRNMARLKGMASAYLKSDIIEQLARDFGIGSAVWKKILAAKNGQDRLNAAQVKALCVDFIRDLEKLTAAVDTL